jgi:hypothetical protein
MIHLIVIQVLSLWSSNVGGQTAASREPELKSGIFTLIPGTTLGLPIDFENEIDTHRCLPLLQRGEVIAWMHRAYATGDRVFVQRCVEYDPGIQETPGSRHGGTRDTWDLALVGTNSQPVRFEPMRIPNWGYLANPSFCGGYIAYWGLRGESLVPSIYNLRSGQRTASRSMGNVTLATDDAYFLPVPEWDEPCAFASFDGRPAGTPTIRLRPRR